MRVAVVGAGGQLGRALARCVPGGTRLDRADLDITDTDAVAKVRWADFDTIVNAAAYTAVDQADSAGGRPVAWAVNAVGVANLARAARDNGRTLVHVSSDYVFDGSSADPASEDRPVAPLSTYGASKAAGDLAAISCPAHYVVRSSWMVGDGPNFVRTMLTLAKRGVHPTVVDDQVGRLTFADDLAGAIVALAASDAPFGIYHITNTGDPVSWADVARAVFALAGHDPARVTGVSTAEYLADRPLSAVRPPNSVLDLRKAAAAGITLPDWHRSLESYVEMELSR
jgi:dTDP-4-dehydrorhamnose 3,5-epimerase